jgi:hypothetical protein
LIQDGQYDFAADEIPIPCLKQVKIDSRSDQIIARRTERDCDPQFAFVGLRILQCADRYLAVVEFKSAHTSRTTMAITFQVKLFDKRRLDGPLGDNGL